MAEPREFLPLNIAILTVSDTRTLADDKSGQTLQERIAAAGHSVADRQITKDDIAKIRRIVKAWVKRKDVDVIISTGGTGLTGRDVTIEAMRPLFEKEIDGFSTLFHMISFPEDRNLDGAVARHGGCCEGEIYFLPAGFARGLPGCVG